MAEQEVVLEQVNSTLVQCIALAAIIEHTMTQWERERWPAGSGELVAPLPVPDTSSITIANLAIYPVDEPMVGSAAVPLVAVPSAQADYQDPGGGHSSNQRFEPPRSNRMLPTDAVERAKFEAIVDTAWERSQIRAQQLRQIKQLVVAGDRDGTFQAMQAFFHLKNPVFNLKKPSRGVAHDITNENQTG